MRDPFIFFLNAELLLFTALIETSSEFFFFLLTRILLYTVSLIDKFHCIVYSTTYFKHYIFVFSCELWNILQETLTYTFTLFICSIVQYNASHIPKEWVRVYLCIDAYPLDRKTRQTIFAHTPTTALHVAVSLLKCFEQYIQHTAVSLPIERLQ